jgi:hypothetical protein
MHYVDEYYDGFHSRLHIKMGGSLGGLLDTFLIVGNLNYKYGTTHQDEEVFRPRPMVML